jgi:hypothetical protein
VPGIEPGPLDPYPGTLTTRPQRRSGSISLISWQIILHYTFFGLHPLVYHTVSTSPRAFYQLQYFSSKMFKNKLWHNIMLLSTAENGNKSVLYHSTHLYHTSSLWRELAINVFCYISKYRQPSFATVLQRALLYTYITPAIIRCCCIQNTKSKQSYKNSNGSVLTDFNYFYMIAYF